MAEVIEFLKSGYDPRLYHTDGDKTDAAGRYVRESDYNALLEKYNELIMQVSNKYPEETRHETALRYLHERENQAQCGNAKSRTRGGGG